MGGYHETSWLDIWPVPGILVLVLQALDIISMLGYYSGVTHNHGTAQQGSFEQAVTEFWCQAVDFGRELTVGRLSADDAFTVTATFEPFPGQPFRAASLQSHPDAPILRLLTDLLSVMTLSPVPTGPPRIVPYPR